MLPIPTFVAHNMAETFVAELQQAADAFEGAIHGRSAGKTRVSTGQVLQRVAVKQGGDAVRSLDVIVANTFASDAPELADWRKDRHVESIGRNTGGGAPSQAPAPMPASTPVFTPSSTPVSTTEPPIVSSPQPSAQPSAAPAPVTGVVDDPLRRAS